MTKIIRQCGLCLALPKMGWLENNAGAGRRFARVSSHHLWRVAFAAFGLYPTDVEPVFQHFTGWHYKEGAFTQRHKDSAPEGYVHTRCNVMIKKPPEGGIPVIDDHLVEVDEGDMWLCFASLDHHESTPIKGGDRLIFSFGGLIPVQQVESIA